MVSILKKSPKTEKLPSEKNILRVAKKHFLIYGFAGARMQAIADEAGINKALLHYYYKSKDGLFTKVFDDEARSVITSIEKITDQKLPILEKIRQLIVNDIDHLLKNREMPMFMMRELARDPKLIQKFDPGARAENVLKKIAIEIAQAKKNKIIRADVEIADIFINMGALAVFPILADPLCRQSFHMTEGGYTNWLEERKKTVPDFIIRAIKT